MEHLYDTHFHLDLQKDRVAAIRDIEENQIYTIAVTNLPDLYRKETTEIRGKYIRIALGFHPELIHQYTKQIPLMWELLPEARYIGEVGLDFVNNTYQPEQVAFFSELIERCRYDQNKIITIHSRQATGKVLELLGEEFRFKAIFHWFTGSRDELMEAINKGCYISVNSAMLRSKRFINLLPLIPSNRILLETDSPFIFFDNSHVQTLQSIRTMLKEYKPDIDIWSNFRQLLSNG